MVDNMRLNDTYTLLEEIGSGGGGVVYKAYHERLKTYVVVKKVKDQVKGLLEGRAEADILKTMKHTYLPRVYDFLEIDGEIYTVMDYIPGQSLDKVVDEQGAIPQKQVLKWAGQLAEALDYLHGQTPPVIHSDIKPSNIMLTPDGDICLIDFNISLALDSSMKNSTGISGGYAPPEQYHNTKLYHRFVQTEQLRKAEKTASEASGEGKSIGTTAADTEASTVAEAENRVTVTATAAGTDAEAETAGATMTDAAGETTAGCETAEVSETEEMMENSSGSTTATGSIVEKTIGHGVDARSDIYSLGATLYHLLTGIRPSCDFEQIIPVSQCGIEISEGFAHIIEKMMELLPEKRYQNGAELLYAFRHIHELDKEYQAYKKSRRNKKIAMALLYVLGASLTAGGIITIRNEKNISYNHLITSSEEAIEAGNFDEASIVLDEAEKLLPQRAEAYSKQLLLLYQQEDYEGCIRYAEEVLRNAPYQLSEAQEANVLSDMYYVLGNAYLETEDYRNAILNLEEAISLYTGSSLYYRDYAIALAKTGNTEQAEEALDRAVALGLGEDSIYMVQGELAFARGEYTEAEESLQKAVSYAETDSLRKRAVLLCDRVYRELGTDYLDREIAMLEQEEKRYGDSTSANSLIERLADAYVRKAEAEEEEGQKEIYYNMALEKFEKLYESGYVTRQLMENIAIVYEQLDEFDKAEDMLLQMADRYPDSYIPYKRLAYLEADRQQEKANADREYQTMKGYYDKAKELYSDQDGDQEMQMLDNMVQELKNGNWI